MGRAKSYFQFPIHALYTGKKLADVDHEAKQNLLQRIVTHAVQSVGRAMLAKTDYEYAVDTAVRESERKDYEWYDADDDTHTIALLGGKALGVHFNGPGATRGQSVQPRRFGNRQVRVRADLLWDHHDNAAAQWREFAVLSAIYAGIGSKQFARLSYEQIRSMAMGYNGIQEFEDHNTDKRRRDDRLTVRQVQYTVRHLHERGLFVRVCPNRRHVYFSNRMSESELAKAIVKREAKKKAKRLVAAALDKTVAQQIELAAAELAKEQAAKLSEVNFTDEIRRAKGR